MVCIATFNNIWGISWRSVLLMDETGVPGENYLIDKLYRIILYRVHLSWARFELTTLVVICTDCIGSFIFREQMLVTCAFVLCKHFIHISSEFGWTIIVVFRYVVTHLLWIRLNHYCCISLCSYTSPLNSVEPLLLYFVM